MENDDALLEDLHHAIERLAEAVADEPPIAGALRRFAACLHAQPDGTAAPAVSARHTPVGRSEPWAFRALLCHALDAGALDERRYDWLMLAESRAAKHPSGAGARTVSDGG